MITMDQLRPLEANVTLRLEVGDASIPLEFVCSDCRGQKTEPLVCPRCQGKGVVPSPQGHAILALLQKHGKG